MSAKLFGQPPQRPAADASRDVTAAVVARAPMGVSALLARIKQALAGAFSGPVTVVGEISNLKLHTSGHIYFRLKDATATVDAAMFRSAAGRLKFRPTDGLEVVVEGRVDVYEQRGQLQLYVERMTPRGAGALELAFRQMREKLAAEGLFDASHKVAIPRVPRAIGVITSATGAAVRDIRRTLSRRWPAAQVYLAAVLVQGEGAAADIAQAIAAMDAAAARYGIDTIILARGGGSLEDLWAFNEEPVARAIFACRTPLITGVGHEVDVTIADLVADLRAPTPTGAAELAVPDRLEMAKHVRSLGERLAGCMAVRLRHERQSLESCLRSAVFRDPLGPLRSRMQYVDELAHRLRAALRHRLAQERRRLEQPQATLAAHHPARLCERKKGELAAAVARLNWALGGRLKRAGDAMAGIEAAMAAAHPRHRVAMAQQRLEGLGRHLEALSYRSVLSRGFSVTRGPDGQILRSAGAVAQGQGIETELHDGRIRSIVGDAPSAPVKPPAPPARKAPPRQHDDEPGLFD
jgi:exodeoxyribonuclease VII large subunit